MSVPAPGAIFGNYELLRLVRKGGMAEIWEARLRGVEGFERTVAVKIILPETAADPQFTSLFVQEAKVAVALGHAHIAQVFDLGKVEDRYFIALEFIAGQNLSAVARQAKQIPVAAWPGLVCYVGASIADALDYAHHKTNRAGLPLEIVHRDVTPQNVMVSYEGEVKLIDFGVASVAMRLARTRPGIIVGKFGYMSPEQVRGMPLDGRSDVFSLGVVLHELLTGERLFAAATIPEVLERLRSAPIPLPSSRNPAVPSALDHIVLAALERDVQKRLTAGALAAALQRVSALESGTYVSARTASEVMHRLFAKELAASGEAAPTVNPESADLTRSARPVPPRR